MREKTRIHTIISNQLDDESSLKDNSDDIYENIHEKERFWQKLIGICQIQENGGLITLHMYLYNYDLRPVEEARRTWSWFNYVFFWIAD